MSKSYHEIMDKIEVTDEMRSRILSRAAQLENKLPDDCSSKQNRASILSLRRWRAIASVAACFVILIAGSTLLKQSPLPGMTMTEGTVDQLVYSVVECDSPEELAGRAGFSVPELKNLPFEADEVSYTWQWNTIAQIDYFEGENTLCFRKAAGEDDISGDYTEYEIMRDVTVHGTPVTIREEDGYCYLATWRADGYTYAVSLMPGVEWSKLLPLLESVV